MLHTATDLMNYKAVVEGDTLPITDLFFNPTLSHLTHVVVRKGVAPWVEHGAVSSRHFGAPDVSNRVIGLGATHDVVDDAPTVEPRTVSETLAQRLIKPVNENDQDIADDVEAVHERAHDWIGAPVRHTAPEAIGVVDDFLIDWPSGKVTHAVVNTGTTVPARQVVLPAECFDVPCDRNPAITSVVDQGALQDAPEIEGFDAVERHWIDTVRTYYKLPI